MDNKSLFSSKGFYLGVAIFTLGIVLMITRVALDIRHLQNNQATPNTIAGNNQDISSSISKLQKKLDALTGSESLKNKIQFPETTNSNNLVIFKFNPQSKPEAPISAIEFIDLGCAQCLADANLVDLIIDKNKKVNLISKINNISNKKDLQINNIAAHVAINAGKFYEYRKNVIKKPQQSLKNTIKNLENSGITLRDFRREITTNSNILLNQLNQDISQANKLNLNSYAIFINNRKFSDNPKSKYKLKDINVYLNNLL